MGTSYLSVITRTLYFTITSVPTKAAPINKINMGKKDFENRLREFNIITSLTKGSGCTMNFNPNTVSIVVTQSKCKSYPNELKELQMFLNNQKHIEWKLTLITL